MYIVYTLGTILRLDGIGDWPGGKSAFNCPPTTDMKLGAAVVAFQRLEQPCRFRDPREFGISTLPSPLGRWCCPIQRGNPVLRSPSCSSRLYACCSSSRLFGCESDFAITVTTSSTTFLVFRTWRFAWREFVVSWVSSFFAFSVEKVVVKMISRLTLKRTRDQSDRAITYIWFDERREYENR